MPKQFKSSLTKPIGDRNILQKKVPRNAKYSGVKASVRTGRNAKNQKIPLDTRGECFKRISRTALARNLKKADSEEESVYDYQASDTLSEYSLQTTTDYNTVEVMLLDCRDEQEYREGHIDGAICFPLPLLRRDAFTKEMHLFKNRPNKIIVVYHLEENKQGILAATLFFEKQYSNVRLLTGGIINFGTKYPNRIVGSLPVSRIHGRPPLSSRNGVSRPASGRSNMGPPKPKMKGTSSRPASGRKSGRSSVRSMRGNADERSTGSVFRSTGRQTISRTSERAWR